MKVIVNEITYEYERETCTVRAYNWRTQVKSQKTLQRREQVVRYQSGDTRIRSLSIETALSEFETATGARGKITTSRTQINEI